MKKYLTVLSRAVCLVGVLVFCGNAMAENKTGKITSIDTKTFSIERSTDKAPFTFNAVKDILNKLKVGQTVDVTYSKDAQGNRVASDVKIAGNAAPVPVEEKKPAAKETEKAPPANSIVKTGKITVIDAVKNTVTIERTDDKKPFTFTAKKELLKDLKKGLLVEVTYEKDSQGNRIASKIKILKTN